MIKAGEIVMQRATNQAWGNRSSRLARIAVARTMRKLSVCILLALAATRVFGGSSDWKPDKPVEIIVNTAPGNSPDRTARAIQRIAQERRLLEVPLTVANRVGGGGAVAYNYLNQRAGDGHFIAIASKALLTNNLMGRGPSYTEFTPLVHLFGEYTVIAVKADSSIKSGRELIDRLKKDPGAVSFGIATSLGNVNHQSVAGALKEAGVDLRKTRNVVFQSGALAMTALLGGHVDVVPLNTGTIAGPFQSGQVRLIAVTSAKRAPGAFAEVPTWQEQGYNVVVSNWRSVIGPKGLRQPQIAYWERALQRITETDDWQKELEKNHHVAEFLGSADTRKMMDSDYAKLKAFLAELELVK
jgi:putative tricarboxylic transport membrane protein